MKFSFKQIPVSGAILHCNYFFIRYYLNNGTRLLIQTIANTVSQTGDVFFFLSYF